LPVISGLSYRLCIGRRVVFSLYIGDIQDNLIVGSTRARKSRIADYLGIDSVIKPTAYDVISKGIRATGFKCYYVLNNIFRCRVRVFRRV